MKLVGLKLIEEHIPKLVVIFILRNNIVITFIGDKNFITKKMENSIGKIR